MAASWDALRDDFMDQVIFPWIKGEAVSVRWLSSFDSGRLSLFDKAAGWLKWCDKSRFIGDLFAPPGLCVDGQMFRTHVILFYGRLGNLRRKNKG